MITKRNYNVDIANSQDRKLLYDFANEMYFGDEPSGNRSTKDKSLIRLPISSAIMGRFLKESNAR